mmetsp:Transcript_4928/g.9236  ORF Transcript_4928/g.9236 Transcript_4928/m.9236 type:complete len:321 (+) Transcript_4928:2147-3109(+)
MEAVYATQDVKDVMDKIAKVIEDLSSDEEAYKPEHNTIKLTKVSFDPKKISWKQYNKTVSQDEFQRTTLARMQKFTAKMRDTLKRAKDEQQRKFNEDYSHKPRIDTKSTAMVSGMKPIYERTDGILKAKGERMKEKQQKKAEAKDRLENSFSFKPQLIDKHNFHATNTVIERTGKWNEIKLKAIADKKAVKQEKELQDVTFKPEITTRARKLRTNSASVESRLLKYGADSKEKIKSRRMERQGSFSPTINQHNFLTPRGVVHERLHSLRKSISPPKLRILKAEVDEVDESDSRETSFEVMTPSESSALAALEHLRLVSHK